MRFNKKLQKRIGVFYDGFLVFSIGDTLGLTPIIEKLYQQTNKQIIVSTQIPSLFLNNPYVKSTNDFPYPEISISPCLTYDCNIIQNYASQLNLTLSYNTIPQIYLYQDEINYGKEELKEFYGYKKIAISLESSSTIKNLDYNLMLPFLNKLKKDGYKLIGLGIEEIPKQYDFDKSFINKTTLRQACSIINECDLYLGVDAGLYHISAALGKPQIVFFRNNGSSINRYFNTYFIDSKIKCGNECLQKHLKDCQNKNRCMDNFDLNDYYYLVKQILSV